jgi:hypothetical protein
MVAQTKNVKKYQLYILTFVFFLLGCKDTFQENLLLASHIYTPPSDPSWTEKETKQYSKELALPSIQGTIRIDWESSVKDEQNSALKTCKVTLVKAIEKCEVQARIDSSQLNLGTTSSVIGASDVIVVYTIKSLTRPTSESNSIIIKSNGECKSI